ncbi:MAG TPA: potassium-transporting ATPase subunit KdpA, partial [Propionibacteriaceae bacterium]|nr:potassium-transporting ATPase subunit KdpA [Propionibacteriaceae bacterium]
MSPVLAAVLSISTVLVILAVVHVPLGTWMHRIFTDTRHTRVERLVYRAVGVDPDGEQRWPVYALSVLAFSVVSVAVLWLLLLVQGHLPLSQGRS